MVWAQDVVPETCRGLGHFSEAALLGGSVFHRVLQVDTFASQSAGSLFQYAELSYIYLLFPLQHRKVSTLSI